MLFIFCIIMLCTAELLYSSDEKLIDACKNVAFGTKEKSSFDSHIQKRITKLQKENPVKYQQMKKFAHQGKSKSLTNIPTSKANTPTSKPNTKKS